VSLTAPFLDELQQAAERAEAAEKQFRREAVQSIRNLETERAFAFRRLNLVRAIAEGIKGVETPESAVARAVEILRSRLGWSDEQSEAKLLICQNFAPVAESIFASLSEKDDSSGMNDFAEALASFESWYSSTHSSPFWVLLEHHMTETPRVDF
jgi:hypothetical protein